MPHRTSAPHPRCSSLLSTSITHPLCSPFSSVSTSTQNDFHARYKEINAFNSDCSATDAAVGNCYGGIARLATAFKSLNCDIKIQTGDFAQGTVYDTIFKQDIAIAGYRAIAYDVAVLGNHEFNRGDQQIYDTVLATPEIIWLNSNVNFSAPPPTFSLTQYFNAHSICWVGALTKSTMLSSKPDPGTTIGDETVAVRSAISKCGQQARVIAINHQGFDADVRMCKNIKEIDLIIGGHSHTNLDDGKYPVKVERDDGSICWVTQAWAYGRYIGVIDVQFDDDGNIKLPGHMYVPMDARIPNDPTVAARLAVFSDALDEEVKEVVAQATADVDGSRKCRERECQMGNLATDAMLVEGSKQGATIALVNGGGMRNSISKGDVTVEDVLNVFPFGNVHAIITLPGSGVIEALEYGFTAVDDDDNRGRYPQVAGMVVVADESAPAGQRVKSVTIGGKPINPTKSYKLVTNSFLATGGDGYPWDSATSIELSGRALNVLVQEYLTANSPYTPVMEGRVVNSASA